MRLRPDLIAAVGRWGGADRPACRRLWLAVWGPGARWEGHRVPHLDPELVRAAAAELLTVDRDDGRHGAERAVGLRLSRAIGERGPP